MRSFNGLEILSQWIGDVEVKNHNVWPASETITQELITEEEDLCRNLLIEEEDLSRNLY